MLTNVNAIKEIQKVIIARAEAIRNKDVTKSLANYSSNILSFDVIDPLQFDGCNAVKERLEKWFATFNGLLTFEISDLQVNASQNIAFCHNLNHVNGQKIDGTTLDMWWRETTCYVKINESWMVTHVHSSVPFDVNTGKSSQGLKPEKIILFSGPIKNSVVDMEFIIRAYFMAYETKDIQAVNALLNTDFSFSSPDDPHLTKEEYLEKCWPFNLQLPKYTFNKLSINGNSVFVFYTCETIKGNKFYNTEYFSFEGNLIKDIRVFYGGAALME